MNGRRTFRLVACALLALCLIAVLAIAWYAWRLQPTMSGTLKTPGLIGEVTIIRDEADVTHIQATHDRDAWFALGYVHAKERGWQLEFNRRLMHGRLSEVLGPAALDIDKLMRTLGIMQAARNQITLLPPDILTALQAYSDGVNSFRTHSRQSDPLEFQILGFRPGGWDPVDSIAWTLMMALDLGNNWSTEAARLSAAAVLDNTMLWQLFPPYEGERPASSVDLPAFYRELGVYRQPSAAAAALDPGLVPEALNMQTTLASLSPESLLQTWLASLGHAAGKGSNNWAVPGRLTASGKPLLANDPHLELSAPAIWYMASLKSPGLQVAGATIPGLPFVVLGRTRNVAWTFTNTGPDVQDLYLERLDPEDPSRYQTPEGWASFETRIERIPVKGEKEVELVVRESRHGPVLSDIQTSLSQLIDTRRYAVALRWSALDSDNRTMLAGIRMNQANSIDAMLAAGAHHHSPMQSVVMADTEGRIAFKAMGHVPLRSAKNELQGLAPVPGWDARYDWVGWIPYEETPEVLMSDEVIVTANQRIHGKDYPHFMGQEWHPDYRQRRILELLATTDKHTPDTMATIQGDVLSLAMLRLLPHAQAAATDAAAQAPDQAWFGTASELLQNFDGQMAADRPEPLILAAWADRLTRRLLEPKIGPERFRSWYGPRHFRRTLEMVLEEPLPHWCAPLDCATQSRLAMTEALMSLSKTYGRNPEQWRWGEAHPAIAQHRPLGELPLLAPLFNVSQPSGGDHFTINVGQYRAIGDMPYANRQAASLRLIFDLANLDNSRFIYPTGQSGNPLSSRYRDMGAAWAKLETRPLDTRMPESGTVLRLTP